MIRTERLRLLPLREDDRTSLFAIYGDPSTVRYLPEEAWTASNVDEAFGKKLRFAKRGDAFFYVVTLQGMRIGTISAWHTAMKDTWEIGFVFHKSYRHKGYATEAARAVVEDLFSRDDVHRIQACLDARNIPSARVCERIGMRLEAHFIQDYWNKEEWTDSYIYGMLEEDLNAD